MRNEPMQFPGSKVHVPGIVDGVFGGVGEDDLSDFRYLEEELYGIEHIPKSDPATLAEAKKIILEYFEKYTPAQLDADKPHHILASQLEQLFWGDNWDGEISGSMEPTVIDLLVPILDRVKDELPNYEGAVSRFKNLFCPPTPEPWSPELAERRASKPPDPYRYVIEEDQQEVIEKLVSPNCTPEEAVGFALRAIHSGINNFVGTKVASRLISKDGWDAFLSTAGAVHLAGNEQGSLYGSIVEVVYKLSTPHDLTDEKVEELYEFAQNDLEWVSLDTYLNLRKKAMSLSGVTPEQGRKILREAKQVFFDTGRVKYLSKYMLEHNAGARRALMEIFRESLGVNEIEKSSLQRYQDLSPELLSEEIPPIILYNFIAQYQFDSSTYPPEYRILLEGNLVAASCLLSDSKTVDKLQTVLQHDHFVFRELLELIGRNESFKSRALAYGGGYDIIAHHALRDIDHNEYELEALDYMVNCSAAFLAEETLATFDPTGKLLSLYKVPDHKGLERLDMDLSNYSAMLVQFDGPYNLQENVARIITDWWYCIPGDLKEVISTRVTERGRNIDDFIYKSQEDPINFVKHTVFLANVIGNTPGLIESIQKMILEKLAETYKKLEYPDTIDDNELLILMNTEYGESNLTESEVRDTMRPLSFSAMRHLQEAFKIDFGKLKRREFFGLLNYLRQCKGGEGFSNLTKVAQKAEDEAGALNRVRSFMSLKNGNKDFGDAIVSFATQPDDEGVVSHFFNYYSQLLDSAAHAETVVRKTADCEHEDCDQLAKLVRDNILNRAQKDLENAVRGKDISLIKDRIETYNAEAKVYVAVLRNELSGESRIKIKRAEELNDREKEAMLKIASDNFERTNPGEKFAEFRASVIHSLKASFSKSGTEFRLLYSDEDSQNLISFCRFDTERDDAGNEVTYFGSFNASPTYSGVGEVMLQRVIAERLKDGRPMRAHCDPSQPITRKYIDRGFVATGSVSYGGVEPIFEIWHTRFVPTYKSNFVGPRLSVNEIVLEKEYYDDSLLVREVVDNDQYPELNKNYALTKYFDHGGKTYCLFERLNEEKLRELHEMKSETA